MSLDALVHGERTNALLGWGTTAVVALAAVESFLTGAFLWGGLALAVVTGLSLPALVTRSPTAIVHWLLPAVAAVAVVLGAFEISPELAGYVTIGATALILVVELDVYTEVELSRRFAVVFATMTTMALEALWIIAQFYSDRWFDTAFLRTQVELQWDIVAVTAVGVALGGVAEWYFDQFQPVGGFEPPSSG